jgi:mono/diheme cytochrome c family protein
MIGRTFLAGGCLAFACLFVAVSPAAAEEDVTAADGHDLFLAHCAACHGEEADAGASGDIRGLSRGTILGALGGIEQMPSFSFLTDPEVDAIVTWLGAPDA